MFYCINNVKKDRSTAGAKAPKDCYEIANSIGFKEIVFFEPKKYKNIKVTRFFALFKGIQNWIRLYNTIGNDDWIVIQHPNENIIVGNKVIDICKRNKNTHFIGLIHDLDSLRKWISTSNQDNKFVVDRNSLADETLLKKCEYIICHNDSMKEYLCLKGFDEKKLISLKIFDYLHDCELPSYRFLDRSIIVAGNLDRSKCGYLYKLIHSNRSYEIHLFGPNYIDNSDNKNIIYHGILQADELPGKLYGSFGLVWDGSEIDTCSGSSGEYLRYNNPHKVSLFLSSNMPVIIWKEAALAEFIENNRLGITINSLSEIDECLDKITVEEYNNILNNVKVIGEKLRNGFFLKEALQNIINRMNK